MTGTSPLALLISNTESLQNGLLALLTTLPQIGAVLVAEDGNIALRMIKSHIPALIIIDMSMPDMSNLILQVKADTPNIQIIAIIEDTAQQKAVETSRVDGMLRKGFSPQKLIALIENLIGEQD